MYPGQTQQPYSNSPDPDFELNVDDSAGQDPRQPLFNRITAQLSRGQ